MCCGAFVCQRRLSVVTDRRTVLTPTVLTSQSNLPAIPLKTGVPSTAAISIAAALKIRRLV